MTAAEDISYFPALDKCLAGESRLISWRTAYRAICEGEDAIENTALEQFLSDDETVGILSSALDPFAKPTPDSAQALDTKTAPIHVSQANDKSYDLEELKSDAKWLSKELDVQELVALRVAIIEWQERPADQLLNALSNAAICGPGNAASFTLASSTAEFALTSSAATETTINFADETVRRRRLFSIFSSERAHILRLSADLVGRANVQSERKPGLRSVHHSTRVDQLATNIMERMCMPQQKSSHEQFCTSCIQTIEDALRKAESNSVSRPTSIANDPSYLESYIRLQYEVILHTLRLLLTNVYIYAGIPSASLVQSWFSALERNSFLQSETTLLQTLDFSVPHYLVAVISADILKAHLAIDSMLAIGGREQSSSLGSKYIDDERCTVFINKLLHGCAAGDIGIAAPAIAAWSAITLALKIVVSSQRGSRERQDDFSETSRFSRRSSRDFVSDLDRLYDVFSTSDIDEAREDPSRYFAGIAFDRMRLHTIITELGPAITSKFASFMESATAFICKDILLNVIRDNLPHFVYSAEILEAIMALLTPDDVIPASQKHAGILATKVLQDIDQLKPFFLDVVLARYPYELSPMLRFMAAVAPARSDSLGGAPVLSILEQLDSITLMVHDHFGQYQLANEDENANYIILTDDLPTFEEKRNLLLIADRPASRALTAHGHEDGQNALCIPAGTQGVIVKETRPFVFRLDHTHSGLEYLGVLLSTFRTSSKLTPATYGLAMDRITAAETIRLLSAVTSSTLSQQSVKEAKHALSRISDTLPDGLDLVYVIAEIFEAELLAYRDQGPQDGSLVLVTACAEFLTMLTKVSPERVWSILARSTLLGLSDGNVALASVVSASEVHAGVFHFLKLCVDLHALLLDNAISGLVSRKTGAKRANNRFDSPGPGTDSTSEKIMSAVLHAYQRILLEVLQEIPSWSFNLPEEKCLITTSIVAAFAQLLRSTYGVDVAKEPSKRLTHLLSPAAGALLAVCLSKTSPNPLVTSLAQLLPQGLNAAEEAIGMEVRCQILRQTNAILDFLTLLVRAAKSGMDLPDSTKQTGSRPGGIDALVKERVSCLASEILKQVPVLAALLASDHGFKLSLFTLLSEVVRDLDYGERDPPPILGQLKSATARLFLEVATQLDRPLSDTQVERAAWDFLTSAMSSRQQWFAMYLLTGTLPKDRASVQKSDAAKTRPLLRSVLDQLSNIVHLNPDRAVGMLKFVATSQQTWAWATNELRSHPDFLKNTIAWLDGLKSPPMQPNAALARVSSKEHEMAAYLYDILAINLHASLEIRDKTVFRALAPKLGFLKQHGILVNAYNRPLHKSLADNLKRKFPESELSDFKRTKVNPAALGAEFCYDRQFATSILRHDASWHGADPSRSQGFYDEFGRANVNLSLLHTQTLLLRNLKTLATTLCEYAEQEPALHVELAKVAKACLDANVSPQMDQPGMVEVLEVRSELAFVILSKLVSLKVQGAEMKALIFSAWDIVCTSPVDHDVATAPEDVRYYSKLLQVLYLAIQPHIYTSPKRDDSHTAALDNGVAGCLQSIVGQLIAPGFRALCGNLHNDLRLALPSDFGLLNAILQAVLSVPGITAVHNQISDIVASSSVIRGGLSLYSWSDQLAEVMDQDPIYGEMAILFLLALSTVPAVAEQMAREGLLTTLSSANLSNYFRKPGGKGPFDEPSRMFAVWTEGFLPLCLNLLDAVGPPIAAEIAAFLNTFPEQLRRAETSLQNATPGPRTPGAGAITLSLVSEAHSLSMIALILTSDVARAAAEGINAAAIPALDYDVEAVKALVEGLMRTKRSLSDRITPASPLEARWEMTPATGASDNLLQAKVMREIFNMLSSFAPPGSE